MFGVQIFGDGLLVRHPGIAGIAFRERRSPVFEAVRTLTEIDFSTSSTPIPFQIGGTGTLNGKMIPIEVPSGASGGIR